MVPHPVKMTGHYQLNIFLPSENVHLATQQERPVPDLWRRLSPMVKILNNNIV